LVGTSSAPVSRPATDGRRLASRTSRVVRGAVGGPFVPPARAAALRRAPADRRNDDKGEIEQAMKRHLIAVGIAVIALAAWVGTASAANDPPPGADQLLGQLAEGSQGAPALS